MQAGFSLGCAEGIKAQGDPPSPALKENLGPYQGTEQSTLLISWVAKLMQTREGYALLFIKTWSPEC